MDRMMWLWVWHMFKFFTLPATKKQITAAEKSCLRWFVLLFAAWDPSPSFTTTIWSIEEANLSFWLPETNENSTGIPGACFFKNQYFQFDLWHYLGSMDQCLIYPHQMAFLLFRPGRLENMMDFVEDEPGKLYMEVAHRRRGEKNVFKKKRFLQKVVDRKTQHQQQQQQQQQQQIPWVGKKI